MDLHKIHETNFDTEDIIVSASLSNFDEVVILLNSGDVIRYRMNEPSGQHLFSVKSVFSYDDGGFDTNALTTIYTLDSIVVVVNDYKRHGFIHYPDKYHALHLWREDYHADISRYPIALYKNKLGVPHIIYSVAWNHVQIMNLDTRQVLTASKSLIEENAEDAHIAFYKNFKEENKLPWPSRYDYFFGELQISPNNKKFLSAGWSWGSCDTYNIFDIDNFIESNRIAHQRIDSWEHCIRAVCWIDDKTVAVTYNPFKEGDENTNQDSQNEIHFYKINRKKTQLDSKIVIGNINIEDVKMRYNKRLKVLVLFSKDIGVAIFELNGKLLYANQNQILNEYYSEMDLFLKFESKSFSVYQIIE
jgi:hypothetical protein